MAKKKRTCVLRFYTYQVDFFSIFFLYFRSFAYSISLAIYSLIEGPIIDASKAAINIFLKELSIIKSPFIYLIKGVVILAK